VRNNRLALKISPDGRQNSSRSCKYSQRNKTSIARFEAGVDPLTGWFSKAEVLVRSRRYGSNLQQCSARLPTGKQNREPKWLIRGP
jgi:hypothetical protein